ncbi:hypothetical protein N7447_003002 [Penicillium robsamsonii]|uniref:uncharacterized protein n=1 Tax=Penicillium robsamsonii TaxID=1792511 RepID=UPI00254884E9|nr:uncharacterized protein N7447_003002 [Penicillium robsamsonii]KAJ5836976.1 hypothetical protein N7447_003002 [Penicillium robsamsonii]
MRDVASALRSGLKDTLFCSARIEYPLPRLHGDLADMCRERRENRSSTRLTHFFISIDSATDHLGSPMKTFL